ncbi:hypothetical protein B0J17DRAFT_666538 [Rhizoctonia solani]|nr:hypothetical protein B0J17DRAFT_666538 [Rhizoctonia solani]
MFAITKLAVVFVSALGFASSAVAAPVEADASNKLVARGPYDVHNGLDTDSPSAGVGACGWSNGDNEWVAAVGTALFQDMMVGEYSSVVDSARVRTHRMYVADGNPNHDQACGKTASVTYAGKTITVGIVDRCYACGYDDIDLSPSAFQQFAGLGKCGGRLKCYLYSLFVRRCRKTPRSVVEVQLSILTHGFEICTYAHLCLCLRFCMPNL